MRARARETELALDGAPLTDRRRKTHHRLREVDALATMRDPVRVESSLLVIEPQPHGEGWSFASGLVTREDGATVQRRCSLKGA